MSSKCYYCDGKGGIEQLTGTSEDDTTWDICRVCKGTGKQTN